MESFPLISAASSDNHREHRDDPEKHEQVEQHELADYRPIQLRKDAESLQHREDEKRKRKREWLEAQDDMKFSHSIQFNAVPDWSTHYIAYSNLKKL